jgi:hypothetical protein
MDELSIWDSPNIVTVLHLSWEQTQTMGLRNIQVQMQAVGLRNIQVQRQTMGLHSESLVKNH